LKSYFNQLCKCHWSLYLRCGLYSFAYWHTVQIVECGFEYSVEEELYCYRNETELNSQAAISVKLGRYPLRRFVDKLFGLVDGLDIPITSSLCGTNV
jgi:hypothetical protein